MGNRFYFFVTYYRDHLSVYTRAYPETDAGSGLLKSLGIPLAVITNKMKSWPPNY